MIHSSADVKTHSIGEDTTIWQYVVILKHAKIGRNCNINCHVFIENDVEIGDNVTIKSGVQLWDGIKIKDNVFIGPNVSFTNDKNPRSKLYPEEFQNIIIGEGASIGAGAVILGDIEIGNRVLVGAGAVVTKDIPDRALVVGNPAKIVGWINKDGTKMQKGEDKDIYLDKFGESWKVVNKELIKL